MRTAVFIAALLCAATPALAVLPAGSAQKQSWEIGPINVKSATAGRRYCSMKNSFANGHSVVFARDTDGGNTIAFDLGADHLQPGAQVAVSLDLMPETTRNLTAIAATRRVLLVNTGHDMAFYSDLAQKETLYLTVGTQEHGYSLKGSSDALAALDECIANMGGAPMPDAEPAPAAKKKTSKRASEKPAAVKETKKKKTADAAPGKPSIWPASAKVKTLAQGAKLYTWQTQGIFASARTSSGRGTLQGMADKYFAQMSKKCTGDFAQKKGEQDSRNGVTLRRAEMACIGNGNDVSAALLFARDGASYTTVTFEGTTAQMEQTLAARDAAAAAISGH
jgi:hypothetical protein